MKTTNQAQNDPNDRQAVEVAILRLLAHLDESQERVLITASVPAVLDRAARLASSSWGISRSELVRRALVAYLQDNL
jgi:hypothetical protein